MDPRELLLGGLAAKRQQEEEAAAQERQFTIDQFQSVARAMAQAAELMIKFLQTHRPKAEITNFPTEISTPDIDKVVEAIEQAQEALKPGNNDDVIEVLEELLKKSEATNKLLKGLEINPKVNVPAPVVNVKDPDLNPILKAIEANKPETVDLNPFIKAQEETQKQLKAVITAVKNIKMPGVPTTQTDPLIRYTAADVDDAGTVQYFGSIATDGHWYIKKYDTSVSPKTVRFAFGTSNYATNFTNRASLTYKLWSE